MEVTIITNIDKRDADVTLAILAILAILANYPLNIAKAVIKLTAMRMTAVENFLPDVAKDFDTVLLLLAEGYCEHEGCRDAAKDVLAQDIYIDIMENVL